MSFLNELINSVNDEDLREELHERVAIVVHKIKFMDKVPFICLDIAGNSHEPLNHLTTLAGGEPVEDPMLAKVIIYFEYHAGIAKLTGKVPESLQSEWPAVKYNHVYLFDDSRVLAKTPQDLVESLEDIAEILHPGFFVFGNEGKHWIGFN